MQGDTEQWSLDGGPCGEHTEEFFLKLVEAHPSFNIGGRS